jgi:hypothetical protein
MRRWEKRRIGEEESSGSCSFSGSICSSTWVVSSGLWVIEKRGVEGAQDEGFSVERNGGSG